MGRRRPERLVINQDVPDPFPLLPVEANDDDCGVGSWVPQVKHRQLCRYIDTAWAAARSPRWPGGWVYLDPFCGPGRIRVAGETKTRPGGAVVAWRQSEVSGTPFARVLVGDVNSTKLSACEARLKALGAPVTAFNMPAVGSVTEMVKAVPARALCLAYVDPYNLSMLSFNILRELAQLRVDLVINFFSSDLWRNVDSVATDELNPGWRDRIPTADRNRGSLADAWFEDWQDQVRRLGFRMSRYMPTVPNSRNSEMYRLVFFAKKEFPIGLWDDVAAGPTPDLFAALD